MAEINRYYFPDPNGDKKEVMKGVIGSDGSVTALNQWSNRRRELCGECEESLSSPQRIKMPDLFDYKYFRTPGTMIADTGSRRSASDLNDTIIYETWRKRDG